MMKKNVLYTVAALTVALTSCDTKEEVRTDATQDTAVLFDHDNTGSANTTTDYTTYNWDVVDSTVPDAVTVTYPEITVKDLVVRESSGSTASNTTGNTTGDTSANKRFSVYEMGDNILFPLDKSTLTPTAEENLKQVAQSIKQRYPNGWIRLYGFTDSTYTKEYNQQLSLERAQAVKQWFVNNGFEANRITVKGEGEKPAVTEGKTPEARHKNRRVEIAAGNF